MHVEAPSESKPSDSKFSGFSRREFVVATLATGFALAVQPVSAETIHTDDKGLVAGEVKIRCRRDDSRLSAMPAEPAKGTGFPVVLVVQEIFGVHEHIQGSLPPAGESRLHGDRPRAVCAARRRVEDHGHSGDHSRSSPKCPTPRSCRTSMRASLGPRRPARRTSISWRSPGSAGAAGSCGCTRPTTRS